MTSHQREIYSYTPDQDIWRNKDAAFHPIDEPPVSFMGSCPSRQRYAKYCGQQNKEAIGHEM